MLSDAVQTHRRVVEAVRIRRRSHNGPYVGGRSRLRDQVGSGTGWVAVAGGSRRRSRRDRARGFRASRGRLRRGVTWLQETDVQPGHTTGTATRHGGVISLKRPAATGMDAILRLLPRRRRAPAEWSLPNSSDASRHRTGTRTCASRGSCGCRRGCPRATASCAVPRVRVPRYGRPGSGSSRSSGRPVGRLPRRTARGRH